MNHILRLQADLTAVRAEFDAKAEAIQAFRVHLAGDKFAGEDADGNRRDWIAVTDVLAWLDLVRTAGEGMP